MSRKTRPSEKAAILDKAADLLETKGWCTGDLWEKDGIRFGHGEGPEVWKDSNPKADRFCAIGAVLAVAPNRGDEAVAPVYTQLMHDYGINSLVLWNDDQKDKRKVIRLFRRTARNLRNRKGPFKP